jgi:hypothetical protein
MQARILVNSTFLAIPIIAYEKLFSWKLLESSPTILIRELRVEVSENFENLSEKRDLIQRSWRDSCRKQWTSSMWTAGCVAQQT